MKTKITNTGKMLTSFVYKCFEISTCIIVSLPSIIALKMEGKEDKRV